MSNDQMVRTSGTLPVAQHLKPKPAQNFDCCPRYSRLPMPFAHPWLIDCVDVDDATGLTIEGEA
jgi:hypothetical protein